MILLFALALALALLLVRLALPAGTPRIRPPRGAGPDRSIAVLERVRLGESDQSPACGSTSSWRTRGS
jgi:hypothetical protein